MGMYTELVLNVTLRSDTPPEAMAVLRHLANGDQEPTQLPDHPFFKCERWRMVMQCSSHYFIPFALSKLEVLSYAQAGGYLSTRSDLKNYDDEINLFVDWLTPYIDALPGDCLGYQRYEEDQRPTLLYYGQPVVWKKVE
jgi:hypothetical protein